MCYRSTVAIVRSTIVTDEHLDAAKYFEYGTKKVSLAYEETVSCFNKMLEKNLFKFLIHSF